MSRSVAGIGGRVKGGSQRFSVEGVVVVHPNARFGGRGNPMPPAVRVEIGFRRGRGETLEEIAGSVGVAVRTVSRVIADADGMPSPRPWKDRSPYRLSRQEREEI